MTTYADPSQCPDCRASLPVAPQTCPRCALPLTGPDAVDLFTTLQRADRILASLRRQAAPAPTSAAVAVGAGTAPGSLLGDVTPYPAPGRTAAGDAPRPAAGGARLSGASVPRILLTLGALCLLVAAVTFLAVAWSWLGVGGRTVVLLVLTAAALGGAGVFARRGLRMAGEALTVVGLGLVALDVIGARHAGWLGDLGDAGLVTTVGSVVATVALSMLLVSMRRPLVAPALVAPFAVLVAGIGAQVPVGGPLPMLLATIVLIGLGRVGTTVPSTPLRISSLVAAAVGWLYVLISGIGRVVSEPTVAHLWGHGAMWPLLAAAALAAAAAPAIGLGRSAALVGYAVAALVGTFVVVAPALDNSVTDATLSLLPCVVAWAAVMTFAPEGLRRAALLPLAGASVLPVAVFLDLAGSALNATLDVGAPFTAAVRGPRGRVHARVVAPWLAAPTLVVLTAAGCAVVGLGSPLRRTTWLVALAAAAGRRCPGHSPAVRRAARRRRRRPAGRLLRRASSLPSGWPAAPPRRCESSPAAPVSSPWSLPCRAT